jgi:hypothetical protein
MAVPVSKKGFRGLCDDHSAGVEANLDDVDAQKYYGRGIPDDES